MKNVLVIGSTGQIGSELTMKLRGIYGNGNVVAGYIKGAEPKGELLESGPAELVDITNAEQIADAVRKHKVDTIYNLAALLSAVAEAKPLLAWKIGIGGLMNTLEVARELERLGVHALVLSAGFVSKAPMEVMRGAMPLRTMAHYMDRRKFWWLKALVRIGGRIMVPTVPYKDAYFLEDAREFRAAVSLPLIYVGGMVSKSGIEQVLAEGFDAVQMARALIRDTDFVAKLRSGETERSACRHSNYCIGRMYTLEMRCNHCMGELPPALRREIDKAEKLW